MTSIAYKVTYQDISASIKRKIKRKNTRKLESSYYADFSEALKSQKIYSTAAFPAIIETICIH